MTTPTAPPPVRSPEPPHTQSRFFAWVSGLGVARSDGWIGGVAAGIAARLRIDPLIVRGVFVVATLCGLPLILLYALAWALLPDADGRIHLRSLIHGRFEPTHLGILAGVVVGMISAATLGFFDLLMLALRGPYYYDPYGDYGLGGPSVLRVVGLFFGAALVIVLLVFVVRAARRTAEPSQVSVPSGDSGNADATDGRGSDAGSGFASLPALSQPQPPAAGGDGPAVDPNTSMDEWRQQHADWQEQDQAWRRQQQDADRAAREQARAERRQAAAAFAAEASERRRIRRASNPRAGIAYIATVLGVALVVAAGVWLWSKDPNLTTAALALFSAGLVLAFGMIIAGLARRRSGFLAFTTVATLLAGIITGGVANIGDVRFGDAWASNVSNSTIVQPFGTLSVNAMVPGDGMTSHPVSIRKASGSTYISVSEGVQLELTATMGSGTVWWQELQVQADGNSHGLVEGRYSGTQRPDGSTVYRETVSPPDTPIDSEKPDSPITVPVTIDQNSGDVFITYAVPAQKESAE